MVTLLLLAILAHTHSVPVAQISGNMVWEEKPYVQKVPDYHPKLRYYGSSGFMFVTPYYITEGHFSVDGAHYSFRPETSIELNHADVDKLAAEFDPETRREKQDNYAKSLAPFDAYYDPTFGTLTLNYVVKGAQRKFSLYKYTDGDESLASNVSGDEKFLPGLWYAPDPYPEKLDSKTRYRIEGLDGLKRFSKEASASDGSQFGLLDLRGDHTYRMDGTVSSWRKQGSQLIIVTDKGQQIEFSIDGNRLLKDGRIAFVKSQ